jgi:hypothetical protein
MPEAEADVTPESNEDNASTDTETAEVPEAAAPDPDAGAKKALVAERTARKAAETELARIKAELAAKDKPAEEVALDTARREAAAEATAKANERILKSDLRAAATGKLADPADALAFIDLTSFDVSDEGEVDPDALNEAIANLIKAKPHLAATAAPRFTGSGDGGAKAPAKPTASIDEQYAAAVAAKDTKLAISLQNQKLTPLKA